MKLRFPFPRRQSPDATISGGVLHTTSRFQRMVGWLRRRGPWMLGGMMLFTLFAWITLPTRAIAWRIGHEAKKAGYHIEIEDVSMSLFGGVTLENVRWTFDPSRPGQVPTTATFEEIEVDIAVLKAIFGIYDIDLEGRIDEGTFVANFVQGGEDSVFSMEISDLPLYALPKARQALNAPLRGIVGLKVDLTMPGGKYAETEGVVEVSCAACSVGDGESLLFVPGAKGLLAKGITVPEIDLGSLGGRIVFEKGVGTTDGKIEAESDDVHVTIDGTVDLKDPFSKSRFNLVMKLQISEELQARADSIKLMVQTAPKTQKLEPPEQGLGFKLTGPLSRPRFMGINSKSREDRLRERRESARKRAERRRKKKADRDKKKKEAEKNKKTAEPEDATDEEEQESSEDEAKPRIGEPIQLEPAQPALPPDPSAVSPSAIPIPVPTDDEEEQTDQDPSAGGAAGGSGGGEEPDPGQGSGGEPSGQDDQAGSGGQAEPVVIQ